MNKIFEKILERLDAKKQYFQKFYEADGKTEEDECINKATQDKALQKHRMEKQVEEIMKSPEYKDLEQKRNDEILNRSIATLAFIACEFLEKNHGYKKAGLTKFLKYVNDCMEFSAKQEDFFTDHDKHYKETMQLDVLSEFGLKIE